MNETANMDSKRAGGTSVPDVGISSSANVPPPSTHSIVSSQAARRIVNILDNGSDLSLSLLVSGDDYLDITRLNVKQLKTVAKSLNASEEFSMPKSGARKYEWVNAIADFFRQSNTSVGAAVCNGTLTAVAKARRSPCKAICQKASTQRKPAAKRMDSDEAMARALQQQYMQDDMSRLMGFGDTLTSNASLTKSVSQAAHQHSIVPHAAAAVAGLKRPANPSSIDNNTKQPKHAPIKVKKEPYHHTTSTNAHSLPHEEDGDRPRDIRESSLVDTMRTMGFTDNREILSGIRAVAAQREEVSIVAAVGWSSQDHVEAAMMWIISQREEAAEARKEDEARFSSERADAEMVQRRKEELELEMMRSDLTDLLGSVQKEIEISSKYFPRSVILQSGLTKQMFATISSVNDSVKATRARKEVLRYLILEKKASDWYGRVLPYSFFHHSAKSRFETWAMELLETSNGYGDQISQRLMKECDDLENSLYNLSEQEEGGVANVPKVFIQAQRDAVKKGLPTKEARDLDDEIEVLEHSSPPKKKPREKRQPADVIVIL